MLPIFCGRKGRHFRQPRQNKSTRGPKTIPKTQYLQITTFRRRFLCNVECSFDKSANNFLLEVRISWITSIFPKKNCLSHIISRGMKSAVLTTWHTFKCTGPLFVTQSTEIFYCLLLFFQKKGSEWFLGRVKRVLETLAENFRQKPLFFNLKS